MEERVRILYLDDDVQSLDHRARILESEYEFEVLPASNAEEGETALENYEVDCILCDLKMPEIDGFEFFESIRYEYVNVPFILFTAHESEEIVKAAYEAGMDDYFPKSALNISYDLLAHRIRRVVEQSQHDALTDTPPVGTDIRGGSIPEYDDGPAVQDAEPRKVELGRGSVEERRPEGSSIPMSNAAESEEPEEGDFFELVRRSVLEPGSERESIEDESASGGETTDQQYTDPEYFRSKSNSIMSGSLRDGSKDDTRPKDRKADDTDGEADDDFLFEMVREALLRGAKSVDADLAEPNQQTRSESGRNQGSVGRNDSDFERDVATTLGTEYRTQAIADESNEYESSTGGTSQSAADGPDLDDLSREELLELLGPFLAAQETKDTADEDTNVVGNTMNDATSNQSERDSAEINAEFANGVSSSHTSEGTPPRKTQKHDDGKSEETGGGSTAKEESATGSPPEADPARTDDISRPVGDANDAPNDESAEDLDVDATDSSVETWVASTDYQPPAELDVEAGDNVLLQCGSRDDRKEAACSHLMGIEDEEGRNVLLVRYKQVNESTLERIANGSNRVRVISIGYSQPVSERLKDTVEVIKINNPNDLTRLGIVVTGTIDDWKTTGTETVVCYDPLDVLLRYKNVQSAFRFLHIFLGRLESGDAISHFHVDPSAGDPQEINTLKPLFDTVLSIDSFGTHLE
ncbi:MAG: response regulator [Natronomonas sp.]